MNLRLYDIFGYLLKWKYRIVAVVILAFFAARYYVGTIQTSNGQVVIRYNDDSVSAEGKFPDGSTFDQYHIASPEVLQNVINHLGLKSSVETLRRRIDVSPIVPNSVQEMKAAKTKDGEEYSYYPDTFMITLSGRGGQPAYKVRELLETITFKYLDYYSEEYNEFAAITNALAELDVDSYDYIELAEIMENNIKQIITRLSSYKSADDTFRSTGTGYSFQDLIYEYEHLRQFDIPLIYADIYSGKISKNPQRLKELYMQRHNEAVLKQKNFEDTAKMTKQKMDSFSKANKEVPNAYNYKSNTSNNDDLEILDGVYDEKARRATSKTTYDTLIENYTNQCISANDAKLDAAHYKKIAEIFASPAPGSVDAEQLTAEIKQSINTTAERMKSLYTKLAATISDYNDYSTQKHISLLTGVKCYDNVNASLYELVAIVISGGGMVLIALVMEIMKAYKKEHERENGGDSDDGGAADADGEA